MPAKKILFTVCLILLITSMGFGWWYAGNVSSERQAQQQEALARGIEAFKTKNYSVALTELRQVPSNDQEGWKARYYEGFAQIMVKDYAAAVLLLEEALELQGADREQFLQKIISSHPDVGNRLKQILDKQPQAEAFFESLVEEVGSALPAEVDDAWAAGKHIGPYRLLSILGVGGMGSVFLAERDDDTFDGGQSEQDDAVLGGGDFARETVEWRVGDLQNLGRHASV